MNTRNASDLSPEIKAESVAENDAAATEAVGYGNPPKTTRFQKGSSGNPRGRPMGRLNLHTVFLRTLRERVVINEHGRRKSVTKLEAALKQMVNKAVSGDQRAQRQVVELAHHAESKQNASELQNTVPNELDQDVIDSIMKRFERGNEGSQERPEANDVEDE